MISIQVDDFDVGTEYTALTEKDVSAGAVVIFVGKVRELSVQKKIHGLVIEHYPGMTEKSLRAIAEQAQQRWALQSWRIIHRVGSLQLGDKIVLVGASSRHREDAFAAAEFMMDFLKNSAPFWKKELTDEGEIWVEAATKDVAAVERW